ncbi:MAG: M42 family metallopeptidase [Bacillota bacterium]|nr:M42 family metallopeptidase [Bacillota bacterium]
MKQQLLTLLRELTAIPGISGQEQPVVRRLVELFKPIADSVEVDQFGNIYALKKGKEGGPRLMIAAHSDEIGAMVKSIEKNGFIRLEKVGGTIDPLLLGRKVRIHGQLGVVGVKAGHLQTPEERTKVVSANNLYIDMGVNSDDEIKALGIRIGDPIVYDSALETMANPDRVVGKAIDDRIGCAVLVKLFERLVGVELEGDLYAVITVQEEVGLRGAAVATFRLNPDYAIALDTIPSGDTPDINTLKELPIRIGQGPVFPLLAGGSARGNIMHPGFKKFLINMAEELGMPYQLATFSGGTTDISSIHLVREGIVAGAVTMPRRYSHSPVELLDLNDAVNVLSLLEHISLNLHELRTISFL